MKWLGPTLFAVAALAAADVLLKFTSGKIATPLMVVTYSSAALMLGLIWLAIASRSGAPLVHQPIGVISAVGVGLAFACVIIGMTIAFNLGAPLSSLSPMVRLGGLVLASAFGLIVLNEPMTWRYAFGAVFVCTGVYLIATR